MKEFNKGDIVYWCNRTGYKFSVHWGRVSNACNHCNGSIVYVDYLSPKETRLVDGIPIDEFKSEDRFKKLPKGWSYNTRLYELTCTDELKGITFDVRDPDRIKELYEEGLFVKKSKIFDGEIDAEITNQGYRIVKRHPIKLTNITSTSIRRDKLYHTYEEAEVEVNANIAELKRQSELSDYDWSVEEIDKILNRWQFNYGKTDIEKEQYREWLLALDKVEDVEVRLWDSGVQWKYWKNKRWSNIEL